MDIVFCKSHFHNTSKEVFGLKKKNFNSIHGFQSAILPELKNCQNGTFKPVHEIWIFFWPKHSFEALCKWQFLSTSNKGIWSKNKSCRGLKVPFWQFFREGRNGRALLVRPLRIPRWIWKILFVLGSYELLAMLGG